MTASTANGFYCKAKNACVSHTKGVMRASVRNAENAKRQHPQGFSRERQAFKAIREAKCLCGSHFAEMKRALKHR